RDLEAGLDGVRVETERGEVHTGDLLVGADGIRSTVRARFFGQHDPVYLGYRSHRFVVANRDGLEHFTEFLGRGQRVGLVTIGGLSRRVGEEGQLSGPLACWLRNRRVRREGRASARVQAGLERLLAWP